MSTGGFEQVEWSPCILTIIAVVVSIVLAEQNEGDRKEEEAVEEAEDHAQEEDLHVCSVC